MNPKKGIAIIGPLIVLTLSVLIGMFLYTSTGSNSESTTVDNPISVYNITDNITAVDAAKKGWDVFSAISSLATLLRNIVYSIVNAIAQFVVPGIRLPDWLPILLGLIITIILIFYTVKFLSHVVVKSVFVIIMLLLVLLVVTFVLILLKLI